MIFTRTKLDGAWIIDLDKKGDNRGFFARTFCADEFAAHGLICNYVQINTNFSAKRGTLKGLHWQQAPYSEAKVLHCVSGEVYDVMADMRPSSPTYLQWEGFHLKASERRTVYLPPGCAHGFLTLTDDAEVSYLVSQPYTPQAETGVRFNDPALGINWPAPVETVSDKDRAWPDYVLR